MSQYFWGVKINWVVVVFIGIGIMFGYDIVIGIVSCYVVSYYVMPVSLLIMLLALLTSVADIRKLCRIRGLVCVVDAAVASWGLVTVLVLCWVYSLSPETGG